MGNSDRRSGRAPYNSHFGYIELPIAEAGDESTGTSRNEEKEPSAAKVPRACLVKKAQKEGGKLLDILSEEEASSMEAAGQVAKPGKHGDQAAETAGISDSEACPSGRKRETMRSKVRWRLRRRPGLSLMILAAMS